PFNGATAMHVSQANLAPAASMVWVYPRLSASCFVVLEVATQNSVPSATFLPFSNSATLAISLIEQCGQPTQTSSMSLTWSLMLLYASLISDCSMLTVSFG